MADKVRVGVIGCGAISAAYLGMARNFPQVEVVACADLDVERARAKAREFGVPRATSVDELLKFDDVEIVVNLTVPKAHVPVGIQALQAGKHVYAEKPLGINREEGKQLIDLAKETKLRVGCAPDTFMGAGIQTARKLIDDGAIGRPVAFTAFMMGRGHESWHPSPEFYYEVGGGPMFDMGPYYLTAMLNLFGPIKRLSGSASIAIPQRTITSQPKAGKKITVETPDHITGTIEFANGAVGTIITTFATMFADYNGKQPITVFGEDGTLRVPDPNGFDGPVHLRKASDTDWTEVPHAFPTGYGRSVGFADMAGAIRHQRPHRANGQLAFAVLDAMQGFLDSSETGKHYKPKAKFDRPAPMRTDLPFGVLDE
ncbi:MAG: Gfo/Idh/MocA family protein [Tepidisphaeraceae bacterium]